ncbi:NUDIX hydrolase [Hydrogenophaga sp.]
MKWTDPGAVAIVVPTGEMPADLNGVAFESWTKAPEDPQGWEALTQLDAVEEPSFTPPNALAPAAGVVVVEPDGRVWLVCPTNQFGGYQMTFPKGRQEPGTSLQATALKEAFEETGLQVRLIRHLVDVPRTQTYTRYYVAKRVGGTPSAMGWESQAVMLVPPTQAHLLKLGALDSAVLMGL